MLSLTIVPIYAALLALMLMVLSVAVIRTRRDVGIGLGFSGSETLERRIRAHGNFVEYVPLTLLLLAMSELRGAAPATLHGLCLLLVAGRIIHAWGIWRASGGLRVAGMAATLTALGSAALRLLIP